MNLRLSTLFLVMLPVLPAGPAAAADPEVEIRTSAGTVRLVLYSAKAPKTVSNFLEYVRSGHYDGTIFHRVIDGFMIQGGGYDKTFRQKATRAPVANEAQAGVKAGLKNEVGSIAMARTSDPDSATAQFFINVGDNAALNWGDPRGDGNGYAVFGKVRDGLDVVMRIAKSPTGPAGPFGRDVPREAVVIEAVSVVRGAKP